MEKPFALFAGFNYYPMGGWGDFQGVFDSIEEAVRAESAKEGLAGLSWDWSHIIDLRTQQEVG